MESVPLQSSKSPRIRKVKKSASNIVRAPDVVIPIEHNNVTSNTTDETPTSDHLRSEDVTPIYQDISTGWHCCFGPIANMACGWPQGSCTALLTVIAVVVFIGGMIGVLGYGIYTNNVNVILATLAVFTNGFSFSFGHYLGKSAATSSSRVPTTTVVSPTV